MINPALIGMLALTCTGDHSNLTYGKRAYQKPGPSKEKRNARKAEKKARKRNRK